jgi:predicted AlkP superfamily phosphohydrolase/phosphomutase
MLADNGISAGIVRWPLTYPAQPLTGFMLTDRFHQLVGSMFEFDGRAAYPDDVVALAREAFASNGAPPVDEVAAAARRDEAYSRAARDLSANRPVAVEAVRYQAIDAASHVYLRYAEPGGFGDVSAAERERFGPLLDRYYAYLDGEIGAAIDRLSPGDLLLVVSGFGMQPVGPFTHAAARVLRDPEVSGTHEDGPDGFLLAYGSTVTPGRKQRGSIVDVTPTILYFLGLPIGRDMDGFARADLFNEPFTAERPITFIPSHGR